MRPRRKPRPPLRKPPRPGPPRNAWPPRRAPRLRPRSPRSSPPRKPSWPPPEPRPKRAAARRATRRWPTWPASPATRPARSSASSPAVRQTPPCSPPRAGEPEVMELFTEAHFWVGAAFIVFLGVLVLAGVHKLAWKALGEAGAKVQSQLDEANRLREKAKGKQTRNQADRETSERLAAEILANAE